MVMPDGDCTVKGDSLSGFDGSDLIEKPPWTCSAFLEMKAADVFSIFAVCCVDAVCERGIGVKCARDDVFPDLR
jgi:hypothetical protein